MFVVQQLASDGHADDPVWVGELQRELKGVVGQLLLCNDGQLELVVLVLLNQADYCLCIGRVVDESVRDRLLGLDHFCGLALLNQLQRVMAKVA